MKTSWLFAWLSLAACSSVELPVERCYRLEVPGVGVADPQCAGVLRVDPLQLGTALDSDRLLQQDGLQLSPRPLSRWVAPLDRLVTDAIVLGLSRARVCTLVKSALDPGPEDWTLRGRIIDFAEADVDVDADGVGDGAREARVTLELWLEGANGLVFRDEFACREPIVPVAAAAGEQAAVRSLSKSLQKVIAAVVDRLHTTGALAAAHDRATLRAAAPGR